MQRCTSLGSVGYLVFGRTFGGNSSGIGEGNVGMLKEHQSAVN